jgi:hypothetical protein
MHLQKAYFGYLFGCDRPDSQSSTFEKWPRPLFTGFYSWRFIGISFPFSFFFFPYLQQFHLGSLHMHIPYLVSLAPVISLCLRPSRKRT